MHQIPWWNVYAAGEKDLALLGGISPHAGYKWDQAISLAWWQAIGRTIMKITIVAPGVDFISTQAARNQFAGS